MITITAPETKKWGSNIFIIHVNPQRLLLIFHFLRLPRIPGLGLVLLGSATTVAWRLVSLASSKGILGCRASWWIFIDFISGAVTLQSGHSSLACPPFSIPLLSANPAFPPPLLVSAASAFAANSFAVCFFGFAFPVMAIGCVGRVLDSLNGVSLRRRKLWERKP